MIRQVEPEFLDELPPGDPAAAGSRGDLVRLNRLMLNGKTVARTLATHLLPTTTATVGALPQARHLLDVGGGDGRFALDVAKRVGPAWHGTHLTVLDRQDILHSDTRAAFASLGWQVEALAADVLEWAKKAADFSENVPGPQNRTQRFDAIMANLFLHHFSESQLSLIFSGLSAQTDLVVAVEPRRAPIAMLLSKCVGLIGCNHVTRHDAVKSVRAGFARQELSCLWPSEQDWQLQEHPAGPFSHLFIARRTSLALPKSQDCSSRITHLSRRSPTKADHASRITP